MASCPVDITRKIDAIYEFVTWTEPTFTDNVGIANVLKTKASGSKFTRGSTTHVHYTAYDAFGNSVECRFSVTIKGTSSLTSTQLDFGCPQGNVPQQKHLLGKCYPFWKNAPNCRWQICTHNIVHKADTTLFTMCNTTLFTRCNTT